MQYAKISSTGRLVAFKPTNLGAPFQQLYDQTDVGGYEEWMLESHDGFHNEFARASQERHDEIGYWAVIHRDLIPKQQAVADDKGRLHVTYISQAGTELVKEHSVWLPKRGFYVPTKSGIFYEGTLAAFETVDDYNEAVKRWESAGFDIAYVSYFGRPDSYENGDMLVGRYFCPLRFDYGRFGVVADWLPSTSGYDWVASRPRCTEENPEIIMEI